MNFKFNNGRVDPIVNEKKRPIQKKPRPPGF